MSEMRTIVQVDQGSGFVTYQLDAYRSQLYDLIHILMGTNRQERDRYPAMQGTRGFPPDVTPTTDAPQVKNPPYYVDGFYLGNSIFSWLTLDEIMAYEWTTKSLLVDPNYRLYEQPTAMQACHDFYDNFIPYLQGVAAQQNVPYSAVRILLGINNNGVGTIIALP